MNYTADDVQKWRDEEAAKRYSREWLIWLCDQALKAMTPQPEAPAINVESRDFYELCQRYRHSQEWFPHGLTPSRTFEDIKKYIRCGETPWKESYDDPTPQRLP
jgi:hypothetical protein